MSNYVVTALTDQVLMVSLKVMPLHRRQIGESLRAEMAGLQVRFHKRRLRTARDMSIHDTPV